MPLIDEAQELAAAHRSADEKTSTIKFFHTVHEAEVIRLLEVTDSVPVTGEMMPFRFSADAQHGVHYPSEIILVNPQEWNDVQEGRISLPTGWNLDASEDV